MHIGSILLYSCVGLNTHNCARSTRKFCQPTMKTLCLSSLTVKKKRMLIRIPFLPLEFSEWKCECVCVLRLRVSQRVFTELLTDACLWIIRYKRRTHTNTHTHSYQMLTVCSIWIVVVWFVKANSESISITYLNPHARSLKSKSSKKNIFIS